MSPPRPQAASRPRAVIEERPLRHPDGSPSMMTHRGWWLVVLNFLLPGSAQSLAGSRRLGRIGLGATLALWTTVIIAVVGGLLWRQGLVTVATNWFVLLAVQILLLAYAVLWAVLTIDTVRLVRLVKVTPGSRIGIAILTIVLLVVSSGGAVYASQLAGSTRDAIGSVFGQSGPTVPPSNGYYNILLLGADSGEGRDSMRFDSISVVSINAESGAVTITGIPRDLPNAPFPESSPLHALYPDGLEAHGSSDCGWGAGINQLVNAVEVCGDGDALYPDTASVGSRPAVEATKDAAEGILGIEIPYYVFIDMHGFAALVDALGGVDITVSERLPKGGVPDGVDPSDVDAWAIGWIEAGAQHMDGDTAQWYARSRYTTNDWDRMLRQRQLQEAILAQFTPTTVLTRFNDIAAAGSAIVETDLPQSMLPYFAELAIKAKEQQVATIELTPAGGVDEFDPDFAYIHSLVDAALHPPTPAPEG